MSFGPRWQVKTPGKNADFKLAVNLYNDKLFDLALEQFRQFVASYPNTQQGIEARYYLGLSQAKLGKHDDARLTFQNFALAFPDNQRAPEAWWNVAEQYLALKNLQEAALAFERLKTFHPKSKLAPAALVKSSEYFELAARHLRPGGVIAQWLPIYELTTEKMRSVRTSGSGAADVSPELIREAGIKMNALAFRSYVMTECPMFTSGRPDDPEEKRYHTDGRPVPGAVARLVDERGRPVGAGVEGKIEAYGPQLCVGYLDAALNADAFTADGFFRTGDLAVMDAEGYVRITGRRKDIIIRKGENLSAKGIEDELASHPKVADVAVIGVPDPQSGERVCACLVLRPGAAALTGPGRTEEPLTRLDSPRTPF